MKRAVLGVPVPLSVVDPDPVTAFEPKKPGLREKNEIFRMRNLLCLNCEVKNMDREEFLPCDSHHSYQPDSTIDYVGWS